MKPNGENIYRPWSSEDQDAADDDDDDDREEARSLLRKKRFNMELLCAIVDPDHTKNEIIEEIKRCLKNGASCEARCQEELATACHVAATFGEDDILTVLLEAGASPSARDKYGRQPHHIAAAKGHLNTLELLVSKDKGLINTQVVPQEEDIEDMHLDSNIHNHQEITSQLPLVTEGSTALHIASRCGFIDIVDFLLDNKAVIGIKDSQQQTALDVAGLDADKSVPGTIVCAAIAADDVSVPESMMPRSLIFTGKKKRKEASHFMELCSSFFKTGIPLSIPELSDKKVTPLHTAVKKQDITAIYELINQGFKLNTQDDKGRTPVHLAVELFLTESLKILLESDSSAVNYRDGKGRTPLHVAVEYEWMKGVHLLLELKTDLKIVSKKGETVLHVAARKGNPQLLKILLDRFTTKVINRRDDEGYTPLFRAVEKGNLECVELLLKNVDDPYFKKHIKTSKDINPSATLLHVAVKSQVSEVLSKLISALHPTETYLNFWNDEGYSALHLSAKIGSVECASIMLATPGIAIDLLSEKEQQSALHFAAASGNYEIIKMLVKESELQELNLLHTTDGKGREPLILALNGGHRECAIYLLSKGANLAARDGGTTALDLISYKLHHPAQILSNLMDGFMVKESPEDILKDDSTELEVMLDFTILLADVRNNSRQFGVIDAINNCAYDHLQQEMFLHPLVTTFLVLKWNQLKYFFKILMFIYIIHILSVTGMATMTYAYHNPVAAWTCKAALLITLVPIICWELLNASRFERFYLLDGETWVKWAVIFTTGLVAILPGLSWARYLTAISVLLAWIELLFLYAKTFTLGLIIQMFFEVAKNVVEVMTTFIVLILGFTFAFLILFNEQEPFTDLWTSFCKVLIMMVELDYNGVFSKEDNQAIVFNVLVRIMYIGFAILVVMVMINLIQSMSVSDVAKLEAQGRSKRMAKKASFLSLLESFCYNEKLLSWLPEIVQVKIENKRSVPKKIYVKPNQPTSVDNPLSEKLRTIIRDTVFNRTVPKATENRDSKVDHLISDVEKMYEMIREIKESLVLLQNQSDKISFRSFHRI